jgi:hypothetical protein
VTTTAHLWAIGYDEVGRADQVREVISRLAFDTPGVEKFLILKAMPSSCETPMDRSLWIIDHWRMLPTLRVARWSAYWRARFWLRPYARSADSIDAGRRG